MADASDHVFMRRAIALAAPRVGRTGANPAVACVIVKDGKVLSEAATADGGRPHAEEQALTLAAGEAGGATAYVTLEPCWARSRGEPSCSQRLVDAGVRRVVIACTDPSPLASSRGLQRLIAAGVETEIGMLAGEAEPLYAEYRRRLASGPASG